MNVTHTLQYLYKIIMQFLNIAITEIHLHEPGSDFLSFSVIFVCVQPRLQCFSIAQLCLDAETERRLRIRYHSSLWIQPVAEK